MADCITRIVDGLDPSCEALDKVGGVKKRVWIGNKDEITAYTQDGNSYVDAITLETSPAASLYQFIGKTYKHNGGLTGEIGENTNIIVQALNLVLYYATPAEREAIEGLYKADDVVAFIETEAGQIEIWGLDRGLRASALAGGTGTALNDSTAITLTLTGQEDALPYVFRAGSSTSLATSIAYLDALS